MEIYVKNLRVARILKQRVFKKKAYILYLVVMGYVVTLIDIIMMAIMY